MHTRVPAHCPDLRELLKLDAKNEAAVDELCEVEGLHQRELAAQVSWIRTIQPATELTQARLRNLNDQHLRADWQSLRLQIRYLPQGFSLFLPKRRLTRSKLEPTVVRRHAAKLRRASLR